MTTKSTIYNRQRYRTLVKLLFTQEKSLMVSSHSIPVANFNDSRKIYGASVRIVGQYRTFQISVTTHTFFVDWSIKVKILVEESEMTLGG